MKACVLQVKPHVIYNWNYATSGTQTCKTAIQWFSYMVSKKLKMMIKMYIIFIFHSNGSLSVLGTQME